ncbi:MAG TPA: Mor transcription activator family protein [Methylococcus sp.]|nr:Mor transcription activator family protein [Methylococcus sp.]
MSWRERVAPFLVELADHAADVLSSTVGLPREVAEHAGYEIMRRVAEACGGDQVYIPKVDAIERHERDEAIWRDFRGNNQAELARKYNISRIWVYAILRRMKAIEMERRQVSLFDEDEGD